MAASTPVSCSSSHDLPEYMDFIRVLVFRTDFTQLVMVHDGVRWDFPYFEYSRENSTWGGTCIDTFRQHVRDWFQLDCAVQFTIVVDLCGDVLMESKHDSEEYGKGALYVMQLQGLSPEELVLPSGAEWKPLSFLSSIAESSDVEEMHAFAEKSIDYMSSRGFMKDPRHRLGWYAAASKFLRSAAIGDGAVVQGDVQQVQVTSSSSIIKLNSSKGWYYAKGSAIGNKEFAITAKIAELFPESSPVVVGTSTELNCFASREFRDEKLAKKHINAVVQKLADVQLGSLSYLEELKQGGCPIRGPDALKLQIDAMADYEFVTEAWYIEDRYKHMAPVAMDLCDKLNSFKIPCTLVHGDFALANATLGNVGEGLLLFDWQFACLAHPFCDFHRLYDDLPEDVRDDVVDEYLRRWSAFEDVSRAKEAFEIARCLGWLLKMWSLSDSLESSEHQKNPQLGYWCQFLVNKTVSTLSAANLLESCS